MRSVRGFHFDRAAASVLTTSLSVCEEQYLFLGSRLGNSLLLQFTEKDIGESSQYLNLGIEKAVIAVLLNNIYHFADEAF